MTHQPITVFESVLVDRRHFLHAAVHRYRLTEMWWLTVQLAIHWQITVHVYMTTTNCVQKVMLNLYRCNCDELSYKLNIPLLIIALTTSSRTPFDSCLQWIKLGKNCDICSLNQLESLSCKYEQSIRRHQTSLRSGAARSAAASWQRAHYEQTWRHPQNRKYITYYNATREGQSQGHG